MSTVIARARHVVAAAVLAFAVCAGSAAPAVADVAAYNAAMQKGDMRAAWQAAKEVWATWDRTKPSTPIIAREFAFAALMSGEAGEAAKLAEVAVKLGATKATPDPEPWVAKVLLRTAEFREKPTPARREALRNALSARQSETGHDLISMVGWQWLVSADWSAREWRDTETDTAMAIALMKRGQGEWNDRIAEAEVMGAAAAFLARRNSSNNVKNKSYDIMADAHDRIVDMIEVEQSQAMLKTLWKAKWLSDAWATAIEAYINSIYEQVGSHVDSSLKARPLKTVMRSEIAMDRVAAVCPGTMTGPRLRYPGSKEYSGMTGAVIVRLATDETGKVAKVTELASVPTGEFSEPVARQLAEWQWSPSGAIDNCTLKNENLVYKVIFRIAGSGN
jgi:hypothetical protein